MGNKTELSFLTVPRFLWVKDANVTREGEDEAGGFDMKTADYFGRACPTRKKQPGKVGPSSSSNNRGNIPHQDP